MRSFPISSSQTDHATNHNPRKQRKNWSALSTIFELFRMRAGLSNPVTTVIVHLRQPIRTISVMSAIAIPFAPLWAKIICGIPLSLISVLALSWGGRNFWLCLRIARGVAPSPPTRAAGALGIVFYSLIIFFALGAAYFLCALVTTEPTLVTDSGVVIGAGPPNYQARFIAWQNISSVQCGMPPRSNVIRRLVVRSGDETVELGNAGVRLEPVRAFIAQHAPAGTINPCRHETYDHPWTY